MKPEQNIWNEAETVPSFFYSNYVMRFLLHWGSAWYREMLGTCFLLLENNMADRHCSAFSKLNSENVTVLQACVDMTWIWLNSHKYSQFSQVTSYFTVTALAACQNKRPLKTNVPVATTAGWNTERGRGLRSNELLWVKLSTAEAATQRLSKQAVGSRGPKPLI